MAQLRAEASWQIVGAPVNTGHPSTDFARLFGINYAPFVERDRMHLLRSELSQSMEDCRTGHHEEYKDLLARMIQCGFPHFRQQVADTACSCLARFDPLVVGLAYEHLTDAAKAHIEEFQVFRDDFDELKPLYVDAFELASRGLAYAGAINNLAVRGDSSQWPDGKTRSLQAVLDMTAHQREFIAGDLGAAALLYAGINRNTRNDIGHRSVHYDFVTGCLVYDRWHGENFILFLDDYLGAVRATFYLTWLTAAASADTDMLGL